MNELKKELTKNEIEVISELNSDFNENISSIMIDNLILAIDTTFDQQTLDKYLLRQFIMAVQNFRKENDIHPWDVIKVGFNSNIMNDLINENKNMCQSKLSCQIIDYENITNNYIEKQCEIKNLSDNNLHTIIPTMDFNS